MIEINKLLNRLKDSRDAQESYIISNTDSLTDDEILGLAACFSFLTADDMVEIWQGGRPRGVLARSDFVNIPGVSDLLVDGRFRVRGIGDSDVLLLPGDVNEILIKLCCPEEECDQYFYARRYNQNDAPDCPRHPGTKVEPCEGS